MTRIRIVIIVMIAALASAAVLAGCGATTSSGLGATGIILHTKTVTINGQQMTVLADANAKTLYYFAHDSATQSACTGGCGQTWPAVLSPSGTATSDPALSGTLALLNNSNGKQVTYNGHPLYRYSGDSATNDAKGDGIGGVWHVVTPDVAPLGGGTGAQPTPPTSGGGGGGGYGY